MIFVPRSASFIQHLISYHLFSQWLNRSKWTLSSNRWLQPSWPVCYWCGPTWFSLTREDFIIIFALVPASIQWNAWKLVICLQRFHLTFKTNSWRKWLESASKVLSLIKIELPTKRNDTSLISSCRTQISSAPWLHFKGSVN